jgi:hypothetical protein
MLDNKMTVACGRKAMIEKASFLVENLIGAADAASIVSVLANGRIISLEPLDNEIKIIAGVSYKVVYIKADNSVGLAEAQKEISEILSVPGCTARTNAILSCAAVDVEFSGLKDVKAKVTLDIWGSFVAHDSIIRLETPADILKKATLKNYESLAGLEAGVIDINYETEVKGGIDKLLDARASVTIRDVKVGEEIVFIDGECTVYALYVAGGIIQNKKFGVPFSGEIASKNVNMASRAEVDAVVRMLDFALLSGEGSEHIRCDITLSVRGYASMPGSIEVVSDAYSLTQELELASDKYFLDESRCIKRVKERVSGSFVLDEKREKIRQILAITAPMVVSQTLSVDNGLIIEGMIASDIIYLGENDATLCARAEVPFNIMLDPAFECGESLSGTAVVCSASEKLRKGDEVDFLFDIAIEVRGVKTTEITAVSSIASIGAKEENEFAISVYIAQAGQSIWDVAKALNSDEQQLLALNPDLSLPFVGGEKVLMYRELI